MNEAQLLITIGFVVSIIGSGISIMYPPTDFEKWSQIAQWSFGLKIRLLGILIFTSGFIIL